MLDENLGKIVGMTTPPTGKLPPKKYFNARILNKDNKFANNIESVFTSVLSKNKLVMDHIYIALTKGHIKVLLRKPIASRS